MHTSNRHKLTATLVIAAVINAATLAAAPALALNLRGALNDEASQPSVCAAQSTLIHGPLDVGRPRPNGVHLPQ